MTSSGLLKKAYYTAKRDLRGCLPGAWRKDSRARVRVEHVYRVVASPSVRDRFDRYAASVGNMRRLFHGARGAAAFFFLAQLPWSREPLVVATSSLVVELLVSHGLLASEEGSLVASSLTHT